MTKDVRSDNPDDQLERSLSAMRIAAIPDGPSQQLLADTLSALRKAETQTHKNIFTRILTMKPLTKIAASILLVFGLSLLAFVMLRPNAVAWADVVQKVRDAKTLTFVASANVPNIAEPMQMKFLMTADGLTRVEGPRGAITIMDPKAGKMLSLQPAAKLAFLTDTGPNSKVQQKMPTNWIEEIKRLNANQAKDLGEKEIDGRKCKGFEADGQGVPFTVWADKASGDPVRVEIDFPIAGNPTKMVMTQLIFDTPLDRALFSIEPPADYKLTTIDMSKTFKTVQQASGEEHVIAVLRGYAERSDGRLPARLDDWATFATLIGNKPPRPAADGQAPVMEDKDVQLMAHVGSLSPFLMSLGKDQWAYLGDGVKLGDDDKIVFWYRHPDTKKYRAVWGDLSAREIEAAEVPRPAAKP
ncbi:MAG: hypothetical protein JWN40_2779 [Phycisphaerales bacterium]|nr:hypothetical protein [Phycisphaerales bacterium]